MVRCAASPLALGAKKRGQGALGKPVEYVDLPIEQWRTLLVEKAGFPEFLATHLAAAAQDHRDGLFSGATNVVETITGRPPQSLCDKQMCG